MHLNRTSRQSGAAQGKQGQSLRRTSVKTINLDSYANLTREKNLNSVVGIVARIGAGQST